MRLPHGNSPSRGSWNLPWSSLGPKPRLKPELRPVRAMRTLRHTLLPLLLIGAFAVDPAGAQQRMIQQRLATNRMTCADAKALVKQDGDVTLSTGSGSISERLVADRSYCDFSEIAELRFVPTRDNAQCPVGYRCKAPEFEDWNWK